MTDVDLTLPALNLDMARRALSAGERARAESICNGLLEATPNDPAVLGLLGEVLLYRDGYADHAVKILSEAASQWPEDPVINARLSEAFLRTGNIAAARKFAAQSISFEPGNAAASLVLQVVEIVEIEDKAQNQSEIGSLPGDAQVLLGRLLNSLGRVAESVPILLQALKKQSTPIIVYGSLMRGLAGLGQLEDALQVCRWTRRDSLDMPIEQRLEYIKETQQLASAVNDARPNHAATLALLGTALLEESRTFDQGVAYLNAAHGIDSESPDFYLGAGLTRLKAGDFINAHQYFSTGAAKGSENVELARMHAALKAIMEHDESALEALPAVDLLVLGKALSIDQRPTEAVAILQKAVAKAPKLVEAKLSLAIALEMIDRQPEALRPLVSAAKLAPESPDVRSQLAVTALASQHFEEGWALYESRLHLWRRDSQPRDFPMPQWQGEDLTGKSVLIWREEGLGDELCYTSCLPDFIKDHECSVTFECDQRMVSLFERTFPAIDIRPEAIGGEYQNKADFHIPLLSLPRHYRGSLDNFQGAGVKLIPDPARVENWRRRLAELGDGPAIGIGWKSGSRSWRKKPLITELSDWDPFLAREDITVINLQHVDWQEDIALAAARLGRKAVHVFDDLDLKDDLEEVTALMAAMDAVVGGRCWVSVFAGAVGTPAHIVSRRLNSFKFGLDYDPWTPSTRYYYVPHYEPWTEPINNVIDVLKQQFSLD